MAFSNADLAAIETAIASGELLVQFSDGRRVQYRTIDELLRARALIKSSLLPAGSASVRSTLTSFSKD